MTWRTENGHTRIIQQGCGFVLGGLCPFLGDSNRRQDKSERPGGLPDNLDELAHVDVVGDQELGLVQDGKLLFSFVTLNDHLQGTDSKR